MYVSSSRRSPVMFSAASAPASRLARDTLAVVLAGGKGTRLGALTRSQCKPALPFGVFYRNIDFSLANCVNSGIPRIGVATQYREDSLIRHMTRVWRQAGPPGETVIEPWRARRCPGGSGYYGTADAVFRNWSRIEALGPRFVLILAGDHVYKMDYRHLLARHAASGADVTVGCIEVPIESASEFGVMSTDSGNRVLRFTEKPSRPESLPGRPERALGSMGIYVFNRELLGRLLREDAMNPDSSHDFGHDLLPGLIGSAEVNAFPFTREAVVGAGYWRDVGTITAYWHAHMELLDGTAGFRLDDDNWPLRPHGQLLRATDVSPPRRQWILRQCKIDHSLLANDCVADRATMRHSVLFPGVSVAANSELENAVILPGASVGRNCSLTDVLIGPNTRIPDGTIIAPMKLHDGASAPAPAFVAAGHHGDTELPAWQHGRASPQHESPDLTPGGIQPPQALQA